ncbi:MAG: aspartate kinase [Candidatus Micrarchaeota archaeon]
MLVQKFGGGILAEAGDFDRAAAIVLTANADFVVVSAVQGVTDALIGLVGKAQRGEAVQGELDALRERHAQLFEPGDSRAVEPVARVFSELGNDLREVSAAGACSPALCAKVVSRGEFLSGLALASRLPGYSFWPAEQGLAAVGGFENARCDLVSSAVPPRKSVVTGFYGVNPAGEVCLFGRGGSDYTAGVVARLAGASKLEFWKNVDGFMTTDPRLAPTARLISRLSFAEASELAHFGAKVMHPAALEPLQGTGCRVEVKNVFNPAAVGTVLEEVVAGAGAVAVAGKRGVALVSVSGDGMVGVSGVVSDVLGRVAQAGVSVDVIGTTQANVSFTIAEGDLGRVQSALSQLEGFKVDCKGELAVVSIVGGGVNSPAFVSRVFSALASQGVRIELVSQGSSGIGLSVAIREGDYGVAVNAVHDEFFGRGGVA